jgi:hypothetical protein
MNIKWIEGYEDLYAITRESKYHAIHRLVLCTFSPINVFKQVNHKDGDKLNNNLNNLEWVTPSENMLHAYKTGLNWSNPLYGEKHPNSKLTEKDVKMIRELHKEVAFNSYILARLYKVSRGTIQDVIHHRTWK